MMKNSLLITFVLVVLLWSCQKEIIEVGITTDTEFAAELRLSPESITIGNNNLVLTTYLWRDFMPIVEENGRKMNCVNKLTDIDGIPILSTIALKRQYVIKDNEIWTASYSEIRKDIVFVLEGFVRDGPKWGPNIKVDVVCEFENSGTIYRIIAKSQLINKTD